MSYRDALKHGQSNVGLDQRPRRCFDCVHYVLRQPRGRGDTGYEACSLDRPLMPCEMYEREPGADG